MNNYTPLRIYVKLDPKTSRALGKKAQELGADDVRAVAADIIRDALRCNGTHDKRADGGDVEPTNDRYTGDG